MKNKDIGLKKLLEVKNKKGFIHDFIRTVIFLLLCSILIRLFIIEGYTVPSESMVSTFRIGDRVFASKFWYGVRLPVVNIHLPAVKKPQRGDIIIFEHPEYKSPGAEWELLNILTLGIFSVDNNEFNVKILVKRCIGKPGDTVIIDSKDNVYINGEKLEKILVKENSNDFHKIYREKNGNHVYLIQEENSKFYSNTASPTFYLPKKGDLLQIVKDENYESENDYLYYINGKRLEDDLINRYRYKDIFNKEMNIDLYNFKELNYEHVIKYNYYFAMGDNRDNSRDSRSWGLVREDLIFGAPLIIFYPLSRFGFIK